LIELGTSAGVGLILAIVVFLTRAQNVERESGISQ
jgi:hypothetical protein